METFRWLSLWVGALASGAVCYVLAGHDRMPDVAVVAGMTLLTGWFVWEDIYVDKLFDRDRKRAEHEGMQWPTYRS